MLRKSFKLKIILPIVAIFVVLVVVINVFLWFRFTAMNSDLTNQKLVANANSLSLFLETSQANSVVAAVSTALYPDTVNALIQRDRAELLHIFTMAQELYGVNFFTVTDSEGVILIRTHEPDNYGDSIASLQSIHDALNGRVSSYFEEGTAVKVSVRTGAPVYDPEGLLIGVISAGVRFDSDSMARELKELLNADVSVFLGNKRIASTIHIDSRLITGTTMDPHIEEIVIGSGLEYSGEIEVQGERYIGYFKPLTDANGEVFAAFATGTALEDLIAQSNNSIRDGILLGLAGLTVSIVLLSIIITIISKPVADLSQNMTNIADGNLSTIIEVKSEDEIGILGKSLKRIADTLHKLLAEIKTMISEHEKGNIDHHLNADEFSGDYKVLAGDILALATVSTIDPLTGIPNRRSFDNRLDLEWKRAKRDKAPLSILMMDLDRFKLYNDTFGHQQGDLALQTVAASITHLLKRSTDFAARWGGEEFVVLLPVTDKRNASYVAERLRAGIEKTKIPCIDDRANCLTVSIGVYTQIPKQNSMLKNFISGADSALYEAKSAGRNTVKVAK